MYICVCVCRSLYMHKSLMLSHAIAPQLFSIYTRHVYICSTFTNTIRMYVYMHVHIYQPCYAASACQYKIPFNKVEINNTNILCNTNMTLKQWRGIVVDH